MDSTELDKIIDEAIDEPAKPSKPLVSKGAQKAAGVAVTAAMIAAAVGSSFSSPADLVQSGQYVEPTPIVETIDLDADLDSSTEESESEEKKTRRGVRDIIRQWILGLPLAVRAVLVLPIYAVGWALIQLGSLAAGALASTVGGTIISWLLLAAVVIGGAALLLKTIFPDIPLRKILTPKRVGGMIIGVGIVYLICAAVSALSPEAAKWISWIKFFGGLTVCALAVYRANIVLSRFKSKTAE